MLNNILDIMLMADIKPSFILECKRMSTKYEGFKDMMELWYEEPEYIEREKILKGMQRLIDDDVRFR